MHREERTVIRTLRGELSRIFQLTLFLKQCALCGNHLVYDGEVALCHPCKKSLSFYTAGPSCQLCGRFISTESLQCGECLLSPPLYRKHVSYHQYSDTFKQLILDYKYREKERLKYFFSQCLETLFKNHFHGAFDYLIPVPSHLGRKRSFDHIRAIATLLSRPLDIPLLTGHLIKTRKTIPQAGLNRNQRLTNLKGAFDLKKKNLLRDKRVLLIDDIYTTGATIHQCTKPLQADGAQVYAMTLARS